MKIYEVLFLKPSTGDYCLVSHVNSFFCSGGSFFCSDEVNEFLCATSLEIPKHSRLWIQAHDRPAKDRIPIIICCYSHPNVRVNEELFDNWRLDSLLKLVYQKARKARKARKAKSKKDPKKVPKQVKVYLEIWYE